MRGIEVRGVTKRYGSHAALQNLSVTFDFGKIYGLLGRNGAGKSTLIGLLANRLFPDEGAVFIDGQPATENGGARERIFCMSEADFYDKDLKIQDQFRWTARFYPTFDLPRAHALAKQVGLNETRRFSALSKGYQSFFKLIVALSLDLPYVVFDEPVLGLDAAHRDLFYRLLLEAFQQKERTYILASHLIEEAAGLMEEVVLLHRGALLLQEEVETLRRQAYRLTGPAAEVEACCAGGRLLGRQSLGGLQTVYYLGEKPALPVGSRVQADPLPLQELFIKLTEEESEGVA